MGIILYNSYITENLLEDVKPLIIIIFLSNGYVTTDKIKDKSIIKILFDWKPPRATKKALTNSSSIVYLFDGYLTDLLFYVTNNTFFYLTGTIQNTTQYNINPCLSINCLFDAYLTEPKYVTQKKK